MRITLLKSKTTLCQPLVKGICGMAINDARASSLSMGAL